MTESRLRTLLLALILFSITGFIAYETKIFETKDSKPEKLINELKARNKQLRLEMGKDEPNPNAYKPGDPIPDRIKEYAEIKGQGMGYDKICGGYNYNDDGLKKHEANITDVLQNFDRIHLNKMANREAKKFHDMHKRLSREERQAKCDEGWQLFGTNGTAIPNYLIKVF